MVGSGRGRRPRRFMAAVVLVPALGLTGCGPGNPYQAPVFPFLPTYREGRAVPVLMSNTEWWRGFGDPLLDQLIAAALRDSPSLAAARARVAAASAARGAVEEPVTLSVRVSGGRKGARNAPDETESAADLGFTWLFDPWRRLENLRHAALARAEAAAAERDAAQLLLVFNMANAYAELRWRQTVLALRQAEAERRGQTLETTRQMMAANSATRLEITRSEARVAEIRSQIPELRAAITAKENEIAVLAGTAPGQLPLDLARRLSAGGAQPRPRLSPDVGIPADLLRNRPDIRIAERNYYAALADLGVAKAGLYPSLSLGGTLNMTRITGGARAAEYFLGPALTLPVFPGGPARATVSGREAAVTEAHALWKETVLQALLEVENAMVSYRSVSQSLQAADRAAQLYAEAQELTRALVEGGGATLGDLIDAEQEVATAENALADARYRRSLDFIALNVQLGSGHAAGGN